MPTITGSSPNLRQLGPILQVQVAVPKVIEDALVAAGAVVPAPVTIPMMVDTGATHTMIQTGIAATLGLSAIGVVVVSTASATGVKCAQYAVRLGFMQGVMGNGKVIEAPMPGGSPVKGLIGRDILANATLVYIGTAGVFSLSL